MSREVDVCTETMAKVYAEQGHWAKAVGIYRRLVANEPEHQDYADALANAEKRMNEVHRKNSEELVPLFREWIQLVLQHEKLQKLRKMRNNL